eukprot:symbB.v1.2.001302.t1/scaffold57.1/size370615/11
MSAARLAELLRRFKLPPSASQAELRRSYYKRAKLLHPDIAGEASEADFKRLREDYDEASQLLQQAASGYGYGRSYGDREGQEGPWDQTYTTPGGQQWTGFGATFMVTKVGFVLERWILILGLSERVTVPIVDLMLGKVATATRLLAVLLQRLQPEASIPRRSLRPQCSWE